MSKKDKDSIFFLLEIAAELLTILLVVVPMLKNDSSKQLSESSQPKRK